MSSCICTSIPIPIEFIRSLVVKISCMHRKWSKPLWFQTREDEVENSRFRVCWIRTFKVVWNLTINFFRMLEDVRSLRILRIRPNVWMVHACEVSHFMFACTATVHVRVWWPRRRRIVCWRMIATFVFYVCIYVHLMSNLWVCVLVYVLSICACGLTWIDL